MKTLKQFFVILIVLLGLVTVVSAGEIASNPSPADGAPCVDPNTVLSWSPGCTAASHDVYLGTDFSDVNDATPWYDPCGVYMDRQDANSYILGDLEPCTTYYWRIDEVNAPPDYTIYKGNVWSFTTKGCECECLKIRVSQESGPDAGDFDNHILGCIDVYETDLSAAEYYAYNKNNNHSFNGPAPALTAGRSHLFIVCGCDGLSLFSVHKKLGDNPGYADMHFELLGDKAKRTVEDDEDYYYSWDGYGPSMNVMGNIFDSNEQWGYYNDHDDTDGQVITGLDGPWSMFVKFKRFGYLNDWYAYSSGGSHIQLELEEGRRVRLDCCDEREPNCIDPPEGMVAWWTFDEGAGMIANDIAGSINDQGTLINGASFTSGMVRDGLLLDETNDYVEVGDSLELNFGEGNLSVDMWVNLEPNTVNTNIRTIVDKRTIGSSTQGYTVFIIDGVLYFHLADGVGSTFCGPDASCMNYSSGVNIADGEWHFIAVTVDRDAENGGIWYVGGVEVGNRFNPTYINGSLTNSAPLWIGRHAKWDDSYLHGILDEIELYNRVLDADEIWEIFNAGSAGKCKCEAGLRLEKKVYDPDTDQWVEQIEADVGTDVTFSIKITNTGTCELEDVIVVDRLPDCIQYKPGGISEWSNWLTVADNTLTWDFNKDPTIKKGHYLYIEYDGHVISGGTNENCVVLYATTLQGELSDEDCATVTAIGPYPDGIKWSQPPVLFQEPNTYLGWDEESHELLPRMVADDFLCDSNEPIKAIRWWGSFLGWDEDSPPEPDKLPKAFYITIWDDVPASVDASYSHPGNVIWDYYCDTYYVDFYGWEYDPDDPGSKLTKFEFYQEFDPNNYWYQPGDSGIYWLGIMALYDICNADLDRNGIVDIDDMIEFWRCACMDMPLPSECQRADLNGDGVIDAKDMIILCCQELAGWQDPSCCDANDLLWPEYPWGWETRPHFFQDDAVCINADPRDEGWPYLPSLIEPIVFDSNSWDMSFELLSITKPK